LASGLLDTLYNNAYPIVIGKFYNSAQLGLYSRAQGYASLPSSNITGILQRVTFPVLSLMQDDDEKLANNYRRLLRMSAFVVFPLMIGLAAIADPLIRVLITSKWAGCIIYLQIICFGMMLYPIHALNLNLLQVKGRSDLFLRLEILKKIIGVCALCITIPFGITAMCIGLVAVSVVALYINTYYTGKLLSLGFLIQIKDLVPFFILSMLVGLLMYYVPISINNDLYRLVSGGLIGIVSYVGLAALFRIKEFNELINLIRKNGRK